MRVSGHCYAVTGLGYTAPWCVNAGFIAGSHTTLVVDTGANALSAATIHGYATTAAPANRMLVLDAEKHFDHIGGNSFFIDRGIEVWGHSGLLRTPEEFRAEMDEFNDAIPDPVRRNARDGDAFYFGTRLAMPTRHIAEDTALDLGGGCTAEILITPGHTPTNLSVWVPCDRVLYSADTLVNAYIPNLAGGGRGVEDWRQWLDSIARIEALEPNTVVPGHGAVAAGREAVQALIAAVRRVIERAIAEAGGSGGR